jgi:ribosome-associated translation inhibitor RaiA
MQEVLELAARVVPIDTTVGLWRKRHWQGIHRADDPRPKRTRGRALHIGQLHGAHRIVARIRAILQGKQKRDRCGAEHQYRHPLAQDEGVRAVTVARVGPTLACLTSMRIVLSGANDIVTDRMRTYTEYKMFTSIARYGALVQAIYVTLQPRARNREGFLCGVVIDLGPPGQIKLQARGAHPTAAIDRVCERTGRLLGRREAQSISS